MLKAIRLFAIGALAALAAAQTPAPTPQDFQREIVITSSGTAGSHVEFGGQTFEFISNVMQFDNRVVRGAPYSAEAVTETIQVLADGNRIARRSNARLFRDGEGRTRREQTLAAVGPWAAAGDVPQTTFIHDPVAGASYVLDARTHTARRMPAGPGAAVAAFAGDARRRVAIEHTPSAGVVVSGEHVENADVRVFTHRVEGPTAVRTNAPASVTESLGTQMMDGIEAQGTRTTLTIPAGQIGNERPIQIVSERWYSPALQTVVMSRRNDPQVGETTYRLMGISRSEPDASLFRVPADYTLTDSNIQIRRSPAAEREDDT